MATEINVKTFQEQKLLRQAPWKGTSLRIWPDVNACYWLHQWNYKKWCCSHGRRKFSRRAWHRQVISCFFHVNDDADVDKTLHPFFSTRKIPRVTAAVMEIRFLARNSQVHCNNFHNRITADSQSSAFIFKEVLPFSLTKSQIIWRFRPRKTYQGYFETQAANVWKLTQKPKLDLKSYDLFPQACTEIFQELT